MYTPYSRRQRQKRWRTLSFTAAGLALVLGIWFWPTGSNDKESVADSMLTGKRAALQKLDAPPQTTDDSPSAPILPTLNAQRPGTDADSDSAKVGRAKVGRRSVGPGETTATGKASSARVINPAHSTTQPAAGSANASPATGREAGQILRAGLAARAKGELITARSLINRALHNALPSAERRQARQVLAELAHQMIFSRGVVEGDPLAHWHTVSSGDTLGKIAKQAAISEDLLAQINHLPNKNFIRLGQRLKVIHGPFHATVNKTAHELHIYLQDVYVHSFKVALGAQGSTPTGRWKVVNHLQNPGWTDPRTGKKWHPDDPENPIGEFWIGLEGIEGDAVGQFGYGIHGTIEPETIGQDVSMGCVRLGAEAIAWVYKVLVPGRSFVTITP